MKQGRVPGMLGNQLSQHLRGQSEQGPGVISREDPAAGRVQQDGGQPFTLRRGSLTAVVLALQSLDLLFTGIKQRTEGSLGIQLGSGVAT